MSVQTTYSQTHLEGYLGGRADSGPAHIVSALNEDAVEIPYGRFVVLETTAGNMSTLRSLDYLPAKLPAAITDMVLGVALLDHAHNPNNTDGIIIGDMFSVIQRGRVYVWAEVAMTPNSPIHLRCIVNGAGTAVGQIRASADGVNTVALTNCRVAGTCGAAEIVAVDLNIA